MKLIIVICILVAVAGCSSKKEPVAKPSKASNIKSSSNNNIKIEVDEHLEGPTTENGFISIQTNSKAEKDAKVFVSKIVRSYIDEKGEVSFPVADKIIAIDNGTILNKQEFQKAWPKFCKMAFTRKVTEEEYFESVNLKVLNPKEAGLLEREALAKVYKYKEGDLFIAGSEVKEGVKSFIEYEKGFIFIIRKVNGCWTLVAIGG